MTGKVSREFTNAVECFVALHVHLAEQSKELVQLRKLKNELGEAVLAFMTLCNIHRYSLDSGGELAVGEARRVEPLRRLCGTSTW